MKHFWKYRLIDWLLCAMASVGLIYAICSGFVLEDAFSNNAIAVFAVALIFTLILTLLSYNRVTVWIGIGAAVVIVAMFIILMYQIRPLADETENSELIFFMVAAVSSVYVYLLGRSRAGIIVLFITGLMITAGAEFLEWPEPAWSFILFPVSVVMLFFYRVYTTSLKKVQVGKIRLTGYILQIIVVGVISLGISLVAYYGIVKPLNPPTRELKLIQQLKSMDLFKVLGVSTVKEIYVEDLSSIEEPEEERFEDEEETSAPEEEMTEPETVPEQVRHPETVPAETVTYEETSFSYLWFLLLIPVAIAACYGVKYALRKRWRNSVDKLSNSEAVKKYYALFCKDMEKVGIKRPENITLREFVRNQEYKLTSFDAGNVTFEDLTLTYEKIIYGDNDISDSERKAFETYYDGFYKNLKNEVGTIKYYLTIFKY